VKAFSFATDKGISQIGVEFGGEVYNFSLAWELYKQLKNNGRGPSLNFLQIMVEADFFNSETVQEVFQSLQEVRPIHDLTLRKPIKFLSPIGRPQKILCLGRNYQAHAEELGNVVPKQPLFFSKSPSAIIAHEEKIRLPDNVGRVDYEGELAVIISRSAKQISEKYAYDFIAGYTILNDVTARELQKSDIKEGKPWFRSKSFDTFCPLGPYLIPKDQIKDTDELDLEVRVNGERKQFASISQMIFKIPEIVAYLSRHLTLQPGDIIATGTPEGVGALQTGDVVECEISQIGTLRNPVE
jgi:2-keto-4-pentenoate hydratase/2-oxohepta-3-ene-1,7-dioic acid hydratase in catechol pathway